MSDDQIKQAIQKLAGTHLADEVYLIPCTVSAVDTDALTCDCIAIGGKAVTDIPNVALLAEVDNGMVLIPAIDSVVLVLFSKRQKPFICLFSELQEIFIDIGNSSIDVNNDGIKFNDGSFGGLVKISDLVTRLNNLENAFNELNAKVNTLAPTPVITPLEPTTNEMIENTKITHGS